MKTYGKASDFPEMMKTVKQFRTLFLKFQQEKNAEDQKKHKKKIKEQARESNREERKMDRRDLQSESSSTETYRGNKERGNYGRGSRRGYRRDDRGRRGFRGRDYGRKRYHRNWDHNQIRSGRRRDFDRDSSEETWRKKRVIRKKKKDKRSKKNKTKKKKDKKDKKRK